jgi:hypothetical protein
MAEGNAGLSKHGEIEIDAKGQTSIPGVFAAGDVTTVPYKQIVIAVGAGARCSVGLRSPDPLVGGRCGTGRGQGSGCGLIDRQPVQKKTPPVRRWRFCFWCWHAACGQEHLCADVAGCIAGPLQRP